MINAAGCSDSLIELYELGDLKDLTDLPVVHDIQCRYLSPSTAFAAVFFSSRALDVASTSGQPRAERARGVAAPGHKESISLYRYALIPHRP